MTTDKQYAPGEKFLERLQEPGVIALHPVSQRTDTRDLYKIDPKDQAQFASELEETGTHQISALEEFRRNVINEVIPAEYLGEFFLNTGESAYEITDDDLDAFVNGL